MEEKNIVKSMKDALIDLETQVEDIDNDPPIEEEQSSLEFDLAKAEDVENLQTQYLDIDPFLSGIAEINDKNTARLARATEALLNLTKSQSQQIETLTEAVESLKTTVDAMAAAPAARKAVATPTEAKELLKGVTAERFDKSTQEVPEELADTPELMDSLANISFSKVRGPVLDALRKSYKEGKLTGESLMWTENTPSGYPIDQVLRTMPADAREITIALIKENLN
jgi:methyl-accepting chemotaxis protein